MNFSTKKKNFNKFITTAIFILSSLFLFSDCQPASKTKATFKNNFVYQKVLASNIFSSEILWKLGKKVQERVVGIPKMSDDKKYSTIVNLWPKSVERFQRVGEEIIVLKPDLVILANFHGVDVRSVLNKAGIDYLQLKSFTGFKSYRENVLKIAKVMAAEEQGLELIKQFNLRLTEIKNKHNINRQKTILSYMYGTTMGANSTFDDVVKAAGHINLASQKGIDKYKHLSIEQLKVWRPDYIVISCGQISCSRAEQDFPKKIGLSNLSSKIIAIPSNILTATNERMLDMAQMIQSRIN